MLSYYHMGSFSRESDIYKNATILFLDDESSSLNPGFVVLSSCRRLARFQLFLDYRF